MDRIHALATQLRKAKSFNRMRFELRDLLLSHGVTRRDSKLEINLINRNSDECAFFCTIPAKENRLEKEIEIIIKPDHEEYKILRVMIHVDKTIVQKTENEDHGWKTKKVFRKELDDAEEDIGRVLDAELQKAA